MLDQDLQYVGDYISQLTKLLTDTPRDVMVEIVSILRKAREDGQRVFCFWKTVVAPLRLHTWHAT